MDHSKSTSIKRTGYIMTALSVFFWILGLIPIVNIFTNSIYWIIWLTVAVFKMGKNIKHPNIIFIAFVSFILSLIPIVDWIPWDVIGTFTTFRMAHRAEKKHEIAQGQQFANQQAESNAEEEYIRYKEMRESE